ncbi:MAG TPA: hypothetical protein V6C95_01910, partial [Coleofasciculaceae cyanobacterium]
MEAGIFGDVGLSSTLAIASQSNSAPGVAMSKRKKHNLQWLKQTLELKENHNWKSKPGTRIFVAGRGALRFDVPEDW